MGSGHVALTCGHGPGQLCEQQGTKWTDPETMQNVDPEADVPRSQ